MLEFCEADSQPATIEGSIVTLLAIQLGLFGPSTTAGMADVYYKSQHPLCPSMLAPLSAALERHKGSDLLLTPWELVFHSFLFLPPLQELQLLSSA